MIYVPFPVASGTMRGSLVQNGHEFLAGNGLLLVEELGQPVQLLPVVPEDAQRLFVLPISGLVGHSTWYAIAEEYNALKGLSYAEL